MRLILGSVLGAALLLSGSSAAFAADAEKGKEIFNAKCAMCHQVGEGATTVVGPELNGIVGRKAASIEGFSYSQGMKKLGADGYTWTEAHLDEWIKDPKAMIPDSMMSMAFAGLPDETERADVIAYLKTFSE
ncbi:cytochrome c family protein [Methyloligella sp. 2.7D]|uniref:c-type cytochrome n=1 Tax=unclassified Methyloligella TaxID=2625955 RepID=UPI00157CF7E7|nr:cytochrome c family protein [Methyloligella sp. GL2]QKP78374.1 cytochrome c family protein [Methyloligella sp. GL2]